MADIGFGDAIIQTGDGTVQVRAEVAADDATVGAEVARTLAELAGTSADSVSFNDISASWGDDVTNKAETALVVFLIAISFYLSFRTEWRMAVGALAALVHDILITVGVYSLFQFEVTSATVIAFLTILGYSLYDTLVVFDRVQENEVRPSLAGKVGYDDIMNLSLNQVFMRSVNTTITSVLPVLMVLLVGSFGFGAVTLKEFAIALVIGMLAGTYSSMFVAGPIVNWLKRREPRYAELVGKTGRASRRDLTAMASSTTTRPRKKRDENKVKRLDTKTSLGSANQAAIPARPRKQKRRK
jgi:preprotein translocase subunit SecF